MKDKKSTTLPSMDNLPANTILQAALGDKDAIESVLKAFESYIVEESTVGKGTPQEYVDEDLAQELRALLIEKIPEFRFKAE